jgi:hypothetical protein
MDGIMLYTKLLSYFVDVARLISHFFKKKKIIIIYKLIGNAISARLDKSFVYSITQLYGGNNAIHQTFILLC